MRPLSILDRVITRPETLTKPAKASYVVALLDSRTGALAGPWQPLQNVTRRKTVISADDVTWERLSASRADQVWIELGRYGLFVAEVPAVADNGSRVRVVWNVKGIVDLGISA